MANFLCNEIDGYRRGRRVEKHVCYQRMELHVKLSVWHVCVRFNVHAFCLCAFSVKLERVLYLCCCAISE